MSELSTVAMAELTDTELDAVSGGLLNNLTLPQLNLNITPQINVAVPTGVAVAVLGAAAAVQQAFGQANGA